MAGGTSNGGGGVVSTGGLPGTGGSDGLCAGKPSYCHVMCADPTNRTGCICFCEGGWGGAPGTGGASGKGGTAGSSAVGGTLGGGTDGGGSACQTIDALDSNCPVDANRSG
jgi:hypothetical protein